MERTSKPWLANLAPGHNSMPLLFGFPECSQTSKHLCDLPALKPGQFAVTRYENQEFQAAVQSTVAGEQCFLLGSITPPECQMLTFLLLGHPLTKEGASLAVISHSLA